MPEDDKCLTRSPRDKRIEDRNRSMAEAYVMSGSTMKKIAEQFDLSPGTVRSVFAKPEMATYIEQLMNERMDQSRRRSYALDGMAWSVLVEELQDPKSRHRVKAALKIVGWNGGFDRQDIGLVFAGMDCDPQARLSEFMDRVSQQMKATAGEVVAEWSEDADYEDVS